MEDLSNVTVLITGASKGIGAAAARMFHAAGANVVLAARSVDSLSDLAAELGEGALAVACDVSDFAQVQNAVTQAVDTFGSLDVLINNAGLLNPIERLASSDPTGWTQIIDVNLKGVYYGIRAASDVMDPGGTIITISSGAAHNPLEGWSAYCASKAGAAMITASTHKELGHKFRVFGLSPGTVATQMQVDIKASGINPVSQLDWSDHIPPEWPAQALMWMCSEDADEFLGQELSLRDEDIRRRSGRID